MLSIKLQIASDVRICVFADVRICGFTNCFLRNKVLIQLAKKNFFDKKIIRPLNCPFSKTDTLSFSTTTRKFPTKLCVSSSEICPRDTHLVLSFSWSFFLMQVWDVVVTESIWNWHLFITLVATILERVLFWFMNLNGNRRFVRRQI